MFGFSLDRRTISIIIAILLGITLFKYISNPDALLGLLFAVPGVLIAITFHEFAHGYAAYLLGDETAKSEGRLSLNPFTHMDPIGMLLLLVAGFGWGKPVHVDPRNYSRKYSMEVGEAIVSAAGPLTNIVLAFIFTLIYCAIYKFADMSFLSSTVGGVTLTIIASTITTNIGLGIFNLIPLPPLDGSKIIKPLLPYKAKEWFENNEQIFYIIFVAIFITGIAGMIISPAISWLTNLFLQLGASIFGFVI